MVTMITSLIASLGRENSIGDIKLKYNGYLEESKKFPRSFMVAVEKRDEETLIKRHLAGGYHNNLRLLESVCVCEP